MTFKDSEESEVYVVYIDKHEGVPLNLMTCVINIVE